MAQSKDTEQVGSDVQLQMKMYEKKTTLNASQG